MNLILAFICGITFTISIATLIILYVAYTKVIILAKNTDEAVSLARKSEVSALNVIDSVSALETFKTSASKKLEHLESIVNKLQFTKI